MKKVGLRIDVDTWRGTREGVPRLLEILDKHHIKGTFFFSVGPDNMGRHLWRLFNKEFLTKILRSNAISLYGWETILAGTAWPGKKIGKGLSSNIKDASSHEIGLHAWDHFSWQIWAEKWSEQKLIKQISLAYDSLTNILKRPIKCSAVAGWRADDRIIKIKQSFNFNYNSDCRGTKLFRPLFSDHSIGAVQIPVTLPTFDEIIGKDITCKNYNNFIINLIKKRYGISVYTIHAEIEGILLKNIFQELLLMAKVEGIYFCSLEELIPEDINTLPIGKIIRGKVPGRKGWVGCQYLL